MKCHLLIGISVLVIFIFFIIYLTKGSPSANTTPTKGRLMAVVIALLTAATYTGLSTYEGGVFCDVIANFVLVWGSLLGGIYIAKGY